MKTTDLFIFMCKSRYYFLNQKMFGMEERVRLPNELLYYISQYIDNDIDSFSLALSGTVRGYAEFYADTRNQNEINISPKCFFLTPSSWHDFFTQYISPEFINNFTANGCYWLPGNQLCDQIVKMINLEDLAINDTKVSLPQLAKILETCKTITKLDFSYHHLPGMENENNKFAVTPVKEAFKKLTSLKISTAVLDARDFVNDPWVFIIKMLSWCKNCSELAIRIIYTGEDITYEPDAVLSPIEMEVDRIVRERLLPETVWIKSLRSLTLFNQRKFRNFSDGSVRCRLLDQLLYSMFTNGQSPASLEHLWIQYFYFSLDMVVPILPSLKAFRAISFDLYNDDAYERLGDLEHLGGLDFFVPMTHLLNLKTAHGNFDLLADEDLDALDIQEDMQEMLNFIRDHQNLEDLSIYYINDLGDAIVNYYVPNVDFQLLKLRRLFCRCCRVIKAMIDEFVVMYPNIEDFKLTSTLDLNDLESRSDVECLSSIRFPRLNSLGLQEFNLHDGSFLPVLIAQCPKLERIYLDGVIIDISSFVSHLDTFLGTALNLRDFRLEIASQSRDIADAICILKSLSSYAPNLQRIAIEWKIESLPADWNYPLADLIVQLALKLERLTCLTLSFFDLNDIKLIEEVHRRIVEEVLPTRPALWFHLGNDFAEASDPSVPAVHYHEMVLTNNYDPPPTF